MITSYYEAVTLLDSNPDAFAGLDKVPWFKHWLGSGNFYMLLVFQQYAIKLHVDGKKERYSARAIWHILRWESNFRENDSEYKLNNNATPYLARLTMLGDASLADLFVLRGKSDQDE